MKRELVHAVLNVVLLNPRFIEAYREGILSRSAKGVLRRYHPRFVIHAADYPEK